MTKDKDIFCKKLFQLTWKQFAQTKQRRYKGIHVFVHFYLQPKLMQVKYTHISTNILILMYIPYSHKRNEWKTEASTRTHTRKTAKDFKHGIGTARLSFLFSFKNIKLSTYILYMKHVGSFFFSLYIIIIVIMKYLLLLVPPPWKLKHMHITSLFFLKSWMKRRKPSVWYLSL